MNRDEASLRVYERLVEALSEDILGASDDDVLASHGPRTARVLAGRLRSRLRLEGVEEATPRSADELAPPRRPGETVQRPDEKA